MRKGPANSSNSKRDFFRSKLYLKRHWTHPSSDQLTLFLFMYVYCSTHCICSASMVAVLGRRVLGASVCVCIFFIFTDIHRVYSVPYQAFGILKCHCTRCWHQIFHFPFNCCLSEKHNICLIYLLLLHKIKCLVEFEIKLENDEHNLNDWKVTEKLSNCEFLIETRKKHN